MQVKVTGKDKNDKEKVLAFNYDFGDDLAKMTQLFGADVVFHNARSNMVVGAQSHARGQIKAGKSDAECVAAFTGPKGWKPGIRKSTPPHERLARDIEKLSSEQRKELLASIGKS
jgi:hypothetical protein